MNFKEEFFFAPQREEFISPKVKKLNPIDSPKGSDDFPKGNAIKPCLWGRPLLKENKNLLPKEPYQAFPKENISILWGNASSSLY